MTIKQLAENLGVSKPTITKVIVQCGLNGKLVRVGNRYELTNEQVQLVKSQIESQNDGRSETPKSQKSQNDGGSETPKSQNDGIQESIISLLQGQLELLHQQLVAKDMQISVKDNQLAAKDKQIEDLTRALVSAQEQHKALADALIAAQALHAGTIQERLTTHAVCSEEQENIESDPELVQHPQEHRGFFARIFGKRR